MNTNAEKRTIEIDSSTIESDKLFGQRKELIIQHKEEVYRLRLTGNDKLILTK
jgi:hemin uptake protein HemP